MPTRNQLRNDDNVYKLAELDILDLGHWSAGRGFMSLLGSVTNWLMSALNMHSTSFSDIMDSPARAIFEQLGHIFKRSGS